MARRYTIEIHGRAFTIDVEDVDVDRFEVAVGGETFEVRLTGDEDLPEAKITPAFEPGRLAHEAAGAPHAAAPGAASAEAKPARPGPVVRRAPAGAASASALAAPLPGVVLDVMVKVGDAVKRGHEVAVLEAMKMQNTIRSPRDGTIAEVCVAPGQAIGHGDAIVRFA